MILLICTWNWAFMGERKSTAGKGAIIVLPRLLYFHNRWRPKIETEFRLIAQPYVTLKSGQVRCIALCETVFHIVLLYTGNTWQMIIIYNNNNACVYCCCNKRLCWYSVCLLINMQTMQKYCYYNNNNNNNNKTFGNQYPEFKIFNYFIYICIRILFYYL